MHVVAIGTLLLAMVIGAANASAQSFTGNTLLPGCKQAARAADGGEIKTDPESLILAGVCTGIIATAMGDLVTSAVISESFRSCAPSGATLGQAIKIVLKFYEDKPETLSMDMRLMVPTILQGVWPCKRP